MSFCSLKNRITPKICRMCVCVLMNKRSFAPFMCLDLLRTQISCPSVEPLSRSVDGPLPCWRCIPFLVPLLQFKSRQSKADRSTVLDHSIGCRGVELIHLKVYWTQGLGPHSCQEAPLMAEVIAPRVRHCLPDQRNGWGVIYHTNVMGEALFTRPT